MQTSPQALPRGGGEDGRCSPSASWRKQPKFTCPLVFAPRSLSFSTLLILTVPVPRLPLIRQWLSKMFHVTSCFTPSSEQTLCWPPPSRRLSTWTPVTFRRSLHHPTTLLRRQRGVSGDSNSTASTWATLESNALKKMSVRVGSSTLSSWVLHRPTACGLHCPFAAAAVTKSLSNLVPAAPSLLSKLVVFQLSRSRSSPWFRRAFVATFFMRVWNADVYSELVRETRKPRHHVHNSAPHHKCHLALWFHPVTLFWYMALHVRVASSLLSQPAQRAQSCMMWPSSGTSKFAAFGVEKVCE